MNWTRFLNRLGATTLSDEVLDTLEGNPHEEERDTWRAIKHLQDQVEHQADTLKALDNAFLIWRRHISDMENSTVVAAATAADMVAAKVLAAIQTPYQQLSLVKGDLVKKAFRAMFEDCTGYSHNEYVHIEDEYVNVEEVRDNPALPGPVYRRVAGNSPTPYFTGRSPD